jgi:hypothetical protein
MPLREVLEAHLLDQDIPLEHRGMRGRVWRAQRSAKRHRNNLEAARQRLREIRAARAAKKTDADPKKGEG